MNDKFQYPSINVRPNTLKQIAYASMLWNFSYFLMYTEIVLQFRTLQTRNKRVYSRSAVINAVKNMPKDIEIKLSGTGFKPRFIYYDEFSF